MRLVRFLLALAAAAAIHFLGARISPLFPLAVDPFLLVAVLEARRGELVRGMFAGFAAGMLADVFSGGLYGLNGFADTLVGYGTARAAQQLVVQRRTGLAAVFAAAAAAQQVVLALLSMLLSPGGAVPSPAWVAMKVATTAVAGLAWTTAASAITRRYRRARVERASRMRFG